MSDKPIHAEVVRADQIRVGDRITWRRAIVEVKAVVDQDGYLDIVYDESETDCAIPAWKDEWIARILPEPVEVREFWRASCFPLTASGTEMQMRMWAEEQKTQRVTIEHVRETILSREEVQS